MTRTLRNLGTLGCLALMTPVLRADDKPAVTDPLAARIARIESGLLPASRLTGSPPPGWTIANRLALLDLLATVSDNLPVLCVAGSSAGF